jgi:S-adenosylmethionine:tRNA ribosyltransferase-isomerase
VITLADLDYELPPDRIAQEPIRPRDAARLLVLERATGSLGELRFRELADQIGSEDLLVVNETRVLPARLCGHKASGGRAEALLLERQPDGTWRALVKARGRLRAGLALRFGELDARIEAIEPGGVCVLKLTSDSRDSPETLIERAGLAPLPPYIRRDKPRAQDLEDYQTIFARVPGAVAAPTASLHFTPELAARLPIVKLTLHVGPGTFRPLRGETVEGHVLEPESFEVPEETARAVARTRARGGHVIAVGTTVVRALETTGGEPGRGRTDLFIRSGHRFRVVDSLITNFHLPRSSLLLLVMSFAGVKAIREAYAHALAKGFRFYSYGDAMWIR